MREIVKDKHGIVLLVEGEPVMRFPKTSKGLAEAKRYKRTWNKLKTVRKDPA